MRKRRVTATTRRLAREAVPGPTFTCNVVCLNCGAEAEASYTHPPERFPCPVCGRRAAVRDDASDPYPEGLQPLLM